MGFIKEVLTDAVEGAIEDTVAKGAILTLGLAAKGAKAAGKAAGKVVATTAKGVAATGKAIEKATETVNGAIDKKFGDAETRHLIREQKYIQKKAGKTCLFIQRDVDNVEGFSVFNTDGTLLYYSLARPDILLQPLNIRILDHDRSLVSEVNPVSGDSSNPVFRRKKTSQYCINVYGQDPVVITEKLDIKKEPYLINPYKWIVEEKKLGAEYRVYIDNLEILHIDKRSGYDVPTYIVDFNNPNKERLFVAITLTIIALRCKM